MRNHFFMPWFGNKRREVEEIINNIHISKHINIVCEPYCGTGSFSFYISSLYPNKYIYLLNDNDQKLIELYTVAQNGESLQKLQDEVNELITDMDKTKYNEIVKNKDSLASYLIRRKIYNRFPGLFPIDNRTVPKTINLIDCPIVNFLRTENVTFSCGDGLEFYKSHCDNKNTMIFLDPPYLDSCNTMYSDNCNTNIYDYLFKNSIRKNKAYIVLCLENNWIIKLLFKNYKIHTYDKRYELSKKKTSHMIATNKK